MAVRRARGFSLIEATIAIGIIGMMIVATGSLLTRIPVNGREVRDQDVALKIAQNEIEILRAAGYGSLPANGPFANILLSSLASSTASITITDFNEDTKQVVANVSWRGTDLIMKSLSLTTLMTQNASLP